MADKRRMSEGAGLIVILALAIRIIFFGGGETEFREALNLTELLLVNNSLNTLDDGKEGEVRIIKFDEDFLSIKHSDKIQLQGEVNFEGEVGDVLVFRYEDGVWKEFSRHLNEGDEE